MQAPYYDEDGIILYHGDAQALLPFVSADVVITDPPYGLGFRGAGWDRDVPQIAVLLPVLFDRVAIVMAPVVAWQFPAPTWVACWARPASNSRSLVGGFNHWSPILLYGDCTMAVDFKSWHAIVHAYPPGFEHPSPKPECLMEWLIDELSEVGEVVLDPFAGSGTTLVAAKHLGRRAIGIEIEERYCELAAQRLAQRILPFEAV